jgi:hypothetical protein
VKRKKPEECIGDFLFCSDPKKAKSWVTQAEADMDCAFLENRRIEISLRDGSKHICKGFRTEQRSQCEFVIACDIPPISEQASGQSMKR